MAATSPRSPIGPTASRPANCRARRRRGRSGVERNLVVTVRDWSDPKHYLHDLIATDRRDPTVNGYGPMYGAAELSTDKLPVLDPVKNTKSVLDVPVADPKYAPSSALANPVIAPSPYFGTEQIWDSQVNAHNPMMDQDGRVYWTAQTRSPKMPPDYCKRGSPLRSAQLYPLAGTPDGFVQNARQITIYDPKLKKYYHVDTCFGTHHLNFAEDANNTLWLSNNSQGNLAVVGWLNTKMYFETGDAAKSQGWTALIVDTNGNGKRDEGYNEPGRAPDYSKDTRIPFGFYGIAWSPRDGSLWGSNLAHPGYVLRMAPGENPPDTALAEIYKIPLPGFGIRGMDVDRNGVVWVPLDSGHIGSFDRTLCKGPLNGPGAELGNKCPEGWNFYPLPGPGFAGDPGAAENPYYTWVDQHNILGLGADVPIATGNQSDSLHALVGGAVIQLRVPYPMGFFAKGLDGRIDDPKVRLEGPRPLGHLRQSHADAHRRHRRAAPGRARHDRRRRNRARWWCTSSSARMRSRIERCRYGSGVLISRLRARGRPGPGSRRTASRPAPALLRHCGDRARASAGRHRPGIADP